MIIFLLMVLLIIILAANYYILNTRKKRNEKKKTLEINRQGISFYSGMENPFIVLQDDKRNQIQVKEINQLTQEFSKIGATAEKSGTIFSKILKEIDDPKENLEVKKSYAIARRTKSKRIRNKHINKIIKLENK